MNTIIRTIRSDDPFARIPKRLLADEAMSWKAKGLLCYLLGKPADWRVMVGDLVNRGRDGGGSVQSGLLELRRLGYAQLRRVVNRGRVVRWELLVADSISFPQTTEATIVREGGTPDVEIPLLEKPDEQNRAITKKEVTKTEGTEKEPRARRGKPEPTNEAKIAVAEFGTAYREHFGVPYGAGPRDAKWAQTLIAFGATPQEVASVARRAWKANGWFGKQATSLERLAARWNEVRAEMAKDSEPVNECGETAFEEIARVSEEEWQASNQRKATA